MEREVFTVSSNGTAPVDGGMTEVLHVTRQNGATEVRFTAFHSPAGAYRLRLERNGKPTVVTTVTEWAEAREMLAIALSKLNGGPSTIMLN